MDHPNSPRRRSLDANPTNADSDNLSAAEGGAPILYHDNY
jgi:hypothetical protein